MQNHDISFFSNRMVSDMRAAANSYHPSSRLMLTTRGQTITPDATLGEQNTRENDV